MVEELNHSGNHRVRDSQIFNEYSSVCEASPKPLCWAVPERLEGGGSRVVYHLLAHVVFKLPDILAEVKMTLLLGTVNRFAGAQTLFPWALGSILYFQNKSQQTDVIEITFWLW